MKRIPFYRRRLVVNWSLQGRYAFVLAMVSASFACALGFFALRAYSELAASRSEFAVAVMIAAGWGVGFTISATAFGLVLSNRWAGPLFRMERYLRQIAEGDLPIIHPPRKGDELHGLFATFRAASESLRTREERELAAMEGTLKLLEPLDVASAQEVSELRTLAERKRASLSPTPTNGTHVHR